MKKCSIWAKAILVYGYFSYAAFWCVVSIIILCDNLSCGLFFMACTALMIVTVCLCTERWGVRLTFMEKGISYKPLLRKETLLDYKNLPRVQYACYMHGNIFAAYRVHFFVLTNRRLDSEELTHINEAAPGKDLIRIRYTRKTYQKLLDALPASKAAEIKAIYAAYIAKHSA